jgi:Glycosyltransferase family 87
MCRFKIISFFNKSFFTDRKFIVSIWMIFALLSAIKQYLRGVSAYNNYIIFKNVFYHTINQQPLYLSYPQEYFDFNHYGPVFSLVIAPFALLPDYLGMPLWCIFNASILAWAITQLPLKSNQINAVFWICAHELLTSLLSVQFNPAMTAIIVLSFVFIEKKKDFWSAMCIALGIFIKLYGVVGLAFFFFSKNKTKFIVSLLFWGTAFFVLPMAISSPEFIIQTYQDWYQRLIIKNGENVHLGCFQDISIMGIIRRFLNDENFSNIPVLVSGLILFGLPYLRIVEYKNQSFRLILLSSVLIFTVIFSTGSESPTYIIAFVGVALWFAIQPRPISNYYVFLLVFCIILTSFSPSDLFPKYINEHYVQRYALKALPCVLIWFAIMYEMLTKKFEKYQSINN